MELRIVPVLSLVYQMTRDEAVIYVLDQERAHEVSLCLKCVSFVDLLAAHMVHSCYGMTPQPLAIRQRVRLLAVHGRPLHIPRSAIVLLLKIFLIHLGMHLRASDNLPRWLRFASAHR